MQNNFWIKINPTVYKWLDLMRVPGLSLLYLLVITVGSIHALNFSGLQLKGLNATDAGSNTPSTARLQVHHIGWYENIYPRAMYHDGKTYAVYHCYNYDTCLMMYDHTQKQWKTPVYVGSNNIGGFTNSHGNPAVLVDQQGQVHVFYGAQQTALKYSRTTVPGDIKTLTPQTPIGDNITYPQALELSNGTIFLFHRSAGYGEDIVFRTSSNHGASWSDRTVLFKSPGVWYGFASKGQNDKIHAVFHVYNTVGTANYPRENIYYMYRDPQDGNWYNIDGNPVTLPITSIEYAENNLKIYNSNGWHTDLDRVREDAKKRLYIGWIEDHSYKLLVRNGSSWEPVRALTFPDEPPLNQADFDITSDLRIKLYLAIKGGEIGLYESTDLGRTFIKTIPQLGGTIHPRKVRVPIIVDQHASDAEVIYYTAKDKYEQGALFVWGDKGFVLKQE
jgi:hypothetical protein